MSDVYRAQPPFPWLHRPRRPSSPWKFLGNRDWTSPSVEGRRPRSWASGPVGKDSRRDTSRRNPWPTLHLVFLNDSWLFRGRIRVSRPPVENLPDLWGAPGLASWTTQVQLPRPREVQAPCSLAVPPLVPVDPDQGKKGRMRNKVCVGGKWPTRERTSPQHRILPLSFRVDAESVNLTVSRLNVPPLRSKNNYPFQVRGQVPSSFVLSLPLSIKFLIDGPRKVHLSSVT